MWVTTLALGVGVRFQHVLDELDATARAVQFVAEQDVGRTGRGADAAMDAGAQLFLGGGERGIGELGLAEVRSHGGARCP